MSEFCCRDSSQLVDNGEGSLVCGHCGLVLQASLEADAGLWQREPVSESPSGIKAKNRALTEFGFKFNSKSMDDILADWAENGLLPPYIIEKTVFRGVQILANYQDPEIWKKKKKTYVSLTEFSAIILYGTLLEEKIPRSMILISNISGISPKKLWIMDGIFYPNSNLDRLPNPSDWMPGICYYIPISFKETRKICYVSDLFYEEFSFRPLTILSSVIHAYLEMRATKFPEKKRMTKKQICEITGVSVSSMTGATSKLFGKNPPPYWDILRPDDEP